MAKRNLILELIAALQLIYLFCAIISVYDLLPEIIPTHYGLGGRPDAYGSKHAIFFFPGIAACIYLFLTLAINFEIISLNGIEKDSIKDSGPILKAVILNNLCIIGMLIIFKELNDKYKLITIICGYLSIWLIIPIVVFLAGIIRTKFKGKLMFN